MSVPSTRPTVLAATFLAGATLAAGAPEASPAPESRPAETATVATEAGGARPGAAGDELFRTSDRCLACHKGVSTSSGEDVSIGFDWRASMMANSARDPYWQAAVRREITDHPEAREEIEAKCSRCHMPMASVAAAADGRAPSVFANLPIGSSGAPDAALAADGVSCAACHQIGPEGLGGESSFTGGFHVDVETPSDGRRAFGPFDPDPAGEGIMRSATGFRPTRGDHVRTSELCASCHTLFTHAILDDGGEGREFPEQVPYLEWAASSYAVEGTTCQDCHMPEVAEEVPVTGVLGKPRAEVSRHVFRGGNFFMLRVLARYRGELGVTALPRELALAAARTEEHLRAETADVTIERAERVDQRVEIDVLVRSSAGHKFPTAYPSRRAWLHVRVTDDTGRTVFESGAVRPDGSIEGNDHDASPSTFEPHYDRITRASQVQIYEGVMGDGDGRPTTGLMRAERWLKENRLLPAGLRPEAVASDPRLRVVGGAADDDDFAAGEDRITYSVPTSGARGALTIEVALRFQPIAYRWAENLARYDSFETRRFLRYYREMAGASSLAVAAASTTLR